MPVHRDKDGNIIEEPTHVQSSDQRDSSGDDTVVVGKSTPDGDDGMTRLYGTPGKSKQDAAASLGEPVVGWLVVIKGPGYGHSVPLGYGRNSIGRAQSERVTLNFGDSNISRTHHASVTYDPRGRKFYISHGDSNNLTYVGDKPVLSTEALEPLTDIGIGETVLRFVPFCGENFDWQDDD